jgi:two-component system nitrogen regulation response regulator GlnG
VAFSLHRLSTRARLPFLALNCAAISPTLVEPTLFGYAKGAFTGAQQAKSGYFEDAGEGTLFLDEIGELPLELQAKLLRVLENGEYQRVGETQTRVSRARIVAATNRDLREEIRQGRFRSDLFHRLSVFTLAVPPLRELGDDKARLLDYYRAHYAAQIGCAPFTFEPAASGALDGLSVPRQRARAEERRDPPHDQARRARSWRADLEAELAPAEAAGNGLGARARAELLAGKPFSLDGMLRGVEQAYLEAALEIAQGNMSQAAKMLGISRTTLYGRLEAARGARLAASDPG